MNKYGTVTGGNKKKEVKSESTEADEILKLLAEQEITLRTNRLELERYQSLVKELTIRMKSLLQNIK